MDVFPIPGGAGRGALSTGVLASAGGIVFVGAFDRFMRAYDDATGTVLWQARLNDVSCPESELDVA